MEADEHGHDRCADREGSAQRSGAVLADEGEAGEEAGPVEQRVVPAHQLWAQALAVDELREPSDRSPAGPGEEVGSHCGERDGVDGVEAASLSGLQAYCDSKLLVTTLSTAVARHWPDVRSNAVDPGWVPTRMGGPHATDDLALGHDTQVWLATSDDPAAATSGQYWHHRRTGTAAPAVHDAAFQGALLDKLGGIAGAALIRGHPTTR